MYALFLYKQINKKVTNKYLYLFSSYLSYSSHKQKQQFIETKLNTLFLKYRVKKQIYIYHPFISCI